MTTIRLLGISGSPREGATAFVVREALEFAESRGMSKLKPEGELATGQLIT